MGWNRPVSETAVRGVALMSIGLALAVVGSLAVGCTSKRGAAPETSGGGSATSPEALEPDHPCVRYSSCCLEFAAELEELPGYPTSTAGEVREACGMVLKYADQPGMDDACLQAYDALAQGIRAMEAFPEFQIPDACR